LASVSDMPMVQDSQQQQQQPRVPLARALLLAAHTDEGVARESARPCASGVEGRRGGEHGGGRTGGTYRLADVTRRAETTRRTRSFTGAGGAPGRPRANCGKGEEGPLIALALFPPRRKVTSSSSRRVHPRCRSYRSGWRAIRVPAERSDGRVQGTRGTRGPRTRYYRLSLSPPRWHCSREPCALALAIGSILRLRGTRIGASWSCDLIGREAHSVSSLSLIQGRRGRLGRRIRPRSYESLTKPRP
jgi:hypothetical protein